MHFIFVILHLAALIFFIPALFVTIPLHIIAAVFSKDSTPTAPSGPTPDTHVKCPDCKELVLREANVCKHCHCKLIPQP